jgi:hypothetical protein
MIVHVVAAEIGERRRLDAQAIDAALIEPLARCFHGGVGDAAVRQPVKRGVEGPAR